MYKDHEKTQKKIQKEFWSEEKEGRRLPDHPVVVATFNPFASMVAELVTDPKKSSVLEVGCGNGFLQFALQKKFGSVVGLDNSQKMLDVNPCTDKTLGSATELPFEDNSFDIVVASQILHHLVESDRKQTFSEMVRVAQTAIVSFEPNRYNPFNLLFCLAKKEERMGLEFTKSYMDSLLRPLNLSSYSIHIENW
jgi:ubiquinone/menaquinone biosynthesis C-methylase UbiE